ncbi:MAG: hypothetical protein AABW49_01950 [Nanoarchaeota archaeon]
MKRGSFHFDTLAAIIVAIFIAAILILGAYQSRDAIIASLDKFFGGSLF